MDTPKLSKYFKDKHPSPLRLAQTKHSQRIDGTKAINVAIGNVSLPIHPAMQMRMHNLTNEKSLFSSGSVRYSETVGLKEANDAILNILTSSNIDTTNLFTQITEGASHAMELITLGVCGEIEGEDRPLLVFDPAYPNYISMANRTGRKIVSISRRLESNGKFTMPNLKELEELIITERPSAVIIIPYDNPTGHFMNKSEIIDIAKLCVKHNLWIVSDEAYRELHYTGEESSSIWKINNDDVIGIEGRRISIESASKVWNACGLRIGAIVTDNKEFHEKSVAENTTNLCPNVIGQYIFGALAHESKEALQSWYSDQRKYYKEIVNNLKKSFEEVLPDAILSSPDASIYTVIDVKNLVSKDFDCKEFVLFCASDGKVEINGENMTLLVAPMTGFYTNSNNHGKTQMRIAFIEIPENMNLVPALFKKLLEQFLEKRQ